MKIEISSKINNNNGLTFESRKIIAKDKINMIKNHGNLYANIPSEEANVNQDKVEAKLLEAPVFVPL